MGREYFASKTSRYCLNSHNVGGSASMTFVNELSWFMPSCEFSFMFATGWDCLEVVSSSEPTVPRQHLWHRFEVVI